MLLAGHGVDEHGQSYWELEDDSGNAYNGNRAYLRFSKELSLLLGSLIIEFVEISL